MEIEPLLLCATPIVTYKGQTALTNATGFFFERDNSLFLVTSQHVFFDKSSDHYPDRVVIELHLNKTNLTEVVDYSIPLYEDATSLWISGKDSSGDVDIALIELASDHLPESVVYTAFGPDNLLEKSETIGIGSPMLIVGFPLAFHDTLHNLPVVRSAINASSFDLRFQGYGYFLTDARTHRGSSGAPVVAKSKEMGPSTMPWKLLGVHSARLDLSNRNTDLDESLGLNCAWFADILLYLTNEQGQ